MNRVKLELTVEDVDFIINVLGSLPTMQTLQAGRLHLIPQLRDQAQFSLQVQQKEPTHDLVERRRPLDTRDATLRDLLLEREKEFLTKAPEAAERADPKVEAQRNAEAAVALRDKLDAIAKSEGRIGDPPFPNTQRFG